MTSLADFAPTLIAIAAGVVSGRVSKSPVIRRAVAVAIEAAGAALLRRRDRAKKPHDDAQG